MDARHKKHGMPAFSKEKSRLFAGWGESPDKRAAIAERGSILKIKEADFEVSRF